MRTRCIGERAWRSPPLQAHFDVIIIGAGGRMIDLQFLPAGNETTTP
ncbi:MAG: hypothetical protein GY785_16940 [Gammaproteobacteria bacterium]|nr:hypothetical protein [Gammaproteobacteria bacterium]